MRFAGPFAALLLGLTVASGTASAATGDSLDTVLARVRDSGAVTRDVHIVSESSEAFDGRTYVVHDEIDGERALHRRCLGDVCEGLYFDGRRAFDVGINQTALPRSLHPDRTAITLHAIETGYFATSAFTDAGGTVVRGDTVDASMVVPRPCRSEYSPHFVMLEVTAPEGATLRAAVDPEHGVVAGVRFQDEATLSLCDYRKVGKYRVPFQRWRNGVLIRQDSSQSIVAARLSMPPGLTARFASPAASVAMQPQLSQPVVPCTVGSQPVMCLIDTGNSGLAISLELVEKLGIEPEGEFEIAGLGHYVTGIARAGPLRVGSATFDSARFVVLHDLHDLGYDVVLGSDALAAAVVTIDYPTNTVTFASPDTAPVNATIPLRFERLLPVVGVQLGSLDSSLAIDTGDESNVDLAYPFYAAHSTLFTPSTKREVEGIGGSSEELIGQISDVRVSTFDMTNASIGATRAGDGVADGHLGSGFLKHFAVTLDYARARLGLTARHGDTAVHAGV